MSENRNDQFWDKFGNFNRNLCCTRERPGKFLCGVYLNISLVVKTEHCFSLCLTGRSEGRRQRERETEGEKGETVMNRAVILIVSAREICAAECKTLEINFCHKSTSNDPRQNPRDPT